ncbi:MAG: family 78 glycoside hydrolase catalytic domain [Eubacteriales bacterium]
MRIFDFTIEHEIEPIGLDREKPRFGWKLSSDRYGAKQIAYRIIVGSTQDGFDVWDSGIVMTDRSIEIPYGGVDLKPCTRYFCTLQIWDDTCSASPTNEAPACQSQTYFETGLMDPTAAAWDGAKWIGPPKNSLCAEVQRIFAIESEIRIPEGSTGAGIIFGANDPRLLDRSKNDHLISGENFIEYRIDISTDPAKLLIYRVGYCPEDSADKPFAELDIVDVDTGKPVIDKENRHQPHTIRIEVVGNGAYTYVDGKRVDVIFQEFKMRGMPGGQTPPKDAPPMIIERPRQLNPVGSNDVPTYPVLGHIGFNVPAQGNLEVRRLTVQNIREPRAVLFEERNDEDSRFASPLAGGESGCKYLIDPSHTSIPMLRTVIPAKDDLKSARLYVTARGIYECHINGEKLGEDWFNPGATQYDKHLLYQTYDITQMMKTGENAVGFYLASGWWSDSQTFTLMNYNYWGDRPSLLAKVVLSYSDGSQKVYTTDIENWKYSGEGPVTYASFFHGEHYNAIKAEEFARFSCADYDDSMWTAPVEIEPVAMPDEASAGGFPGRGWPAPNHTEPDIIGQIGRPVRVVKTIRAKSMTEPIPGVYVYDMGQNMAGVPQITLKGQRGSMAVLRYGEVLYPKLPEYGDLDGMILTENLRDAMNIDKYIFRGDPDGEVYMPRFTFHGYRYIEVSGVSEPPALSDVEGVVLSSLGELTGSFETSDPLVNKLFENITWSQYANFISIPTDCPQRNERMGWGGDAEVFARTAGYNADVRSFFRRYIQAMRDLQTEKGQYPNIAPVGGGFGGIAWESAGIIVPWEIYRQYGDRNILEENYDAMKAYIEYLKSRGWPGLLNVGPLGDWLATDMSTDNNLIWNAIFAYDVRIVSQVAAILGYDDEAAEYRKLFEEIRSHWNETFVDPETGKTRRADGTINDTQCSYALPLFYGIFDKENEQRAYRNLARKTEETGYTVTTGFLGTGPLNPALCDGGYSQAAFRLIRQTNYPSWLYSITQGATTIWERWNSYTVENGFGGNNNMNSFNHYSLGAVGAWMYGYVLGIMPDENDPGYKHFILRPYMESFDFAKGHYDSVYGRIECAWQRDGDKVTYTVTIPTNTSATIYLRSAASCVIQSGDESAVRVDSADDGYVIEAQSGAYVFAAQVK